MPPSPTHKTDYVEEGLARLTSQYTKERVATYDPLTAIVGWSAFYREARTSTQWTDLAASARHLSEPTNPPAFGASLNGQPTWDFNGTNDVLRRATPISSFITASAFTSWVVARIDSFSFFGNARPLWTSTGSAWQALAAVDASGDKLRLFAYSGGVLKEVDVAGPAAGVWVLIETRHEAGNIYIRINNGVEQSLACGDFQDISQNICVGVNSVDSVFFDGGMAELSFHPTALSANDRLKYRNYAKERYGLW